MSVYIRGMEMPKGAYDCVFANEFSECTLCEDAPLCSMERMGKDCPLIPVPVHGRLVDADFIVKRLLKQIQDVGADTELANRDREFISVIGAVSTVIPADEQFGISEQLDKEAGE